LRGAALELATLLVPGAHRYRFPASAVFALDAWRPDLRYAETGTIDAATAEQFVGAADAVFKRSVAAMIVDGRMEMPR